MPAASFTGIKKRGVDEEATPSASTVKTSRSGEELPLQGAAGTIKSLQDCIEACMRENDLFTLAITGTPLVAATQVHAEMLAKIDENVKNLRCRLLAASKAVEAFSRCRVDRVEFKSLNLMELGAQQRRIIHRERGNFYSSENSSKNATKLFEQRSTVSYVFAFASSSGVTSGNFERNNDEGV